MIRTTKTGAVKESLDNNDNTMQKKKQSTEPKKKTKTTGGKTLNLPGNSQTFNHFTIRRRYQIFDVKFDMCTVIQTDSGTDDPRRGDRAATDVHCQSAISIPLQYACPEQDPFVSTFSFL